jgi:clan AA aspartic protease
MITGTVVSRRPTVTLVVRGPGGQQATIEALLDTGFNGFLTPPPSAVTALSLPPWNYLRAGLADGSIVRLAVHTAVVLWDGAERDIEVMIADRPPLLGTALLDGHELVIRFAEGDLVTIQLL